MSNHTPGPWTALEAREDGLVHKSLRPYYYADVCVGPRETHGNSIARVSLGGPGATHNTREAVEANAKLIAAAPDLLAVCQGVLSHPSFKACDCGEPDCATTVLRAAIAKATA